MKKTLLTLAQAGITLALLWWIFRDGEKRALMWETLQTANWWWFLPGLVAVGITTILQTWRWQWLLMAQEIRPGFARTYGMNLIGMFFNLFLPGGTGGDLIKMYYASREAPKQKAAAVLSVLMDRVVGLFALIFLAALISAVSLPELWAAPELRPLLLTLLFVLLGAGGVVTGGFLVEHFQLAGRLPSWLPLRHAFLEVAAAFSTYTKRPKILLATFAISLPTQLLFFFSFYTASRALGAEIGLWQLFTVLPVVLVIAALPISVAGLGVREQLFRVCLGVLYGVPGGVAVLIGFSGFLLMVFWGVLGGVLYIFYRSSSGAAQAVAGMEHEMEELEAEIEKKLP
jgi:glycosyltransferase 2 family protein